MNTEQLLPMRCPVCGATHKTTKEVGKCVWMINGYRTQFTECFCGRKFHEGANITDLGVHFLECQEGQVLAALRELCS